jgi:hypothetical protein
MWKADQLHFNQAGWIAAWRVFNLSLVKRWSRDINKDKQHAAAVAKEEYLLKEERELDRLLRDGHEGGGNYILQCS